MLLVKGALDHMTEFVAQFYLREEIRQVIHLSSSSIRLVATGRPPVPFPIIRVSWSEEGTVVAGAGVNWSGNGDVVLQELVRIQYSTSSRAATGWGDVVVL